MKISTIKYFITDAFKNLKRNSTVSIASIATVMATLFILGVFLLSALNVKQVIKDVESRVEIDVFLKNDITIQQEKELKNTLESLDEIKEIRYETKDEAMNKLREQIGEENKVLVEGLEKNNNPLPNAYIIKVKNPEMVSSVVNKIKDKNGIYKIKEGKKIVDKIIVITKTIKWVGMALFVILIGVSLFLIGNTIKITVYSRRKEIGIMKYIGATDWFIRWPFIIEGVIIGITGAIIGCILLYYIYNVLYLKISSFEMLIQFMKPSYILNTISWEFMLGGILIGAVGSIVSMRKFLDV